MALITLRPDTTPSDALKVDKLCADILRDIGSIHRRVSTEGAMSPGLVALRREVREIQDAMHDAHPDAFFR